MISVSAKTALKNHLKTILYATGIAPLFCRRTSRNALTIVMFHRVLPPSDPRSASADPAYTMDLAVFEAFLDFLGKHFRTVSLAQVEQALAGGAPLPPHAALVTFDDGWEDTARYAAPALQARGIPAVIFVTSGALVCEHTLWRDVAAILSRAGWRPPVESGMSADSWLESLSLQQRNDVLVAALDRVRDTVRPLMMNHTDLQTVMRQGMAIGAHGVTHTPLTSSDQVGKELQDSKNALETGTGRPVSSFAFPHGRYNPALLQQTLASGYDLAFTSDGVLNRLDKGNLPSPVLGRVTLSQTDIADDSGRFSPARAMFYLAFRQIAALDRNLGAYARTANSAPPTLSSYS